MNCLSNVSTPQLEKIHSGKVRESFRIDEKTRMIVTTDRISSFDRVLQNSIPGKGAVLNRVSDFWFSKTSDIVENHLFRSIDAQVALVREVAPIRLEMIVRGYLTGSMWRKYAEGKRTFSGVDVPDGLEKNHCFDTPLVTPTTKEESDREISPRQIVAEGLLNEATYQQMEAISLKLFLRGREILQEKKLILVDTKYEFGLQDGKLVLIDELHTPDSSRFWHEASYATDPANPKHMDKEYVRQYLLAHGDGDKVPTSLPEEVAREASRRYREICELITGEGIEVTDEDVSCRIYRNLVRNKLIKDGYVAIVMGSPRDMDFCQKIRRTIESYGIMVDERIVSAHKNPEDIAEVLGAYESSMEPGAIIAVAGLSNGLGGALAANSTLPVINCPPFKDQVDLLLNLNSSIMLPSKVPAATVIRPESAAHIALRSLNLARLKRIFAREIDDMKQELREADRNLAPRRSASGVME